MYRENNYHDVRIMIMIVGFFSWEVMYRPLGYERVYLPLHKVTDTPFHIQGGMTATLHVISKEEIYVVVTQKPICFTQQAQNICITFIGLQR